MLTRKQLAESLATLAILAACTLGCELLSAYLDPTSLMLVYMVGVTAVAVRSGMKTAVAFVVASALVYDLVFLEPFWTFIKLERHHYFTFGLMLGVGCLIGSLASNLREKTLDVEDKVRRAQARNALANELARATDAVAVQAALQLAIDRVLGQPAALLLLDADQQLQALGEFQAGPSDPEAARTAIDQCRVVGPADGSGVLYLPLIGSSRRVGVLAVGPGSGARRTDVRLLCAFADQASTVLERQQLERMNAEARLEAETERLRSTLLAAISHDFRTPITTIVGSIGTLLEQGRNIDEARQRSLLQGVLGEASRVHQMMSNLLDLTQIEEGAVQPSFEWCPVEELVAAALRPLRPGLDGYILDLDFDADELLWCDPRLIEQGLGNLLGNACRHAPPGSKITVRITTADRQAHLSVSDNGPGFPPGREQEMVKKFSRGSSLSGHGTGLGLAICAAIAKLHGGSLELANRAGAWVQLCMPQPAPPVAPAEALL